jgi:peptidoglycan/LPS O-acetylase OafA/YrhL
MAWTDPVDGYCERVGPAFWAEPVNAVTNLAFVLVALWLWPRVSGSARVLCGILFAIGIGSFLFHTYAQPWAAVLDVLPILLFILTFIYLATRVFLGLKRWAGIAAVIGFFPFASALVPLFQQVPGLGGSAGYAPVPVLIALYALMLWRKDRDIAWRLLVGAGLLSLSIAFRAMDEPFCAIFPIGTHFVWHSLNAIMLGWMISILSKRLEPDISGEKQR